MPFVGRRTELARFRAALAGDPDARPVHFLYGTAGIGKSALLRAYAAEARAAYRPVTEIDGRALRATPDGFRAAAGDLGPAGVLLVDSFEHCRTLEGWLWDQFLPELAAGVVVAVAGREAPDPRWCLDPGWGGLVHVAALPNLSAEDATTLLRAHGVPPQLGGTLLAHTGGHPLALAHAARLSLRGEWATAGRTPRPEAVRLLSRQLTGEVPTERHRTALEVCTHARVTSEELLRAVVGDDAPELFDWLRSRPYVESTATGLVPHAAVREVVQADLRHAGSDRLASLHGTIREHLAGRVRVAPVHAVPGAAGDLIHLYLRHGQVGWSDTGPVEEVPFRPGHADDVLRLDPSAGYWLDRQPEAFWIYQDRRTGRAVGFFAWLRLTADADGADADPLAAAAWRHAREHGTFGPDEHLGLARFAVTDRARQSPLALIALFRSRLLGAILRSSRLAWSYVAVHDDGYWDGHFANLAMFPIAERAHRRALFAHDWRAHPAPAWLRDMSTAMHSGRPMPAAPPSRPRHHVVLSRAEFDAALRSALRDLGRPDGLAGNRLQHTRLVREDGRGLDKILRSTAERLRHERGGERLYRAVATTYFKGAPTQKAAAIRLGLPFGTYRRHLAAGVDALADVLWRYEIHSGPPDGAGHEPDSAGRAAVARPARMPVSPGTTASDQPASRPPGSGR
jgi:hypothetical protein